MKVIFPLLCFFLLFQTAHAQTELIRHRSRGGTIESFNPNNRSGNFGLVEITNEINKDTTSSYKLISNKERNMVTFILFKTENKKLEHAMCMANDEVLEMVQVSETSRFYDRIRNLFIAELDKLRRLE